MPVSGGSGHPCFRPARAECQLYFCFFKNQEVGSAPNSFSASLISATVWSGPQTLKCCPKPEILSLNFLSMKPAVAARRTGLDHRQRRTHRSGSPTGKMNPALRRHGSSSSLGADNRFRQCRCLLRISLPTRSAKNAGVINSGLISSLLIVAIRRKSGRHGRAPAPERKH